METQQPARKVRKAILLNVSDDLYSALVRACSVTRLSKTALITVALENDLKIKGFWPPKVRKAKTMVQI